MLRTHFLKYILFYRLKLIINHKKLVDFIFYLMYFSFDFVFFNKFK